MVTSADINLGDNATIYYLKNDEYMIDADDYQTYKNDGASLVELTGKIVAGYSPDGKKDNGDLIRINKIFLITDEPIPFFTFFNKSNIEEHNYHTHTHKNTIGYLGSSEDYAGKYGHWVHISRIYSVSSAKVDPKNDGCSCKVCKNYIYMGAPNQSDGSLICFSCKDNPIRAYY